MRHSMKPVAVACALLLTTSCSTPTLPQQPAKTYGSLVQSYDLRGKDGLLYGTVELDPVNGGKVYDTEGRLIGNIVPPGQPVLPPAPPLPPTPPPPPSPPRY